MIEIRFVDRIRKWLTFNRLTVLNEHYKSVTENMNLSNDNDRAEVEYLSKEFEKYSKKTNRLSNWRIFFYIAGLFTGSLLPFVQYIVNVVDFGNTVLSSLLFSVISYIFAIAFVIIFILTVKINLNIMRMQDAMMHLVAIYSSNKKRDSKKMLQRLSKVI